MAATRFKDALDSAVKNKRKKFSYGNKTYEANQTQKKAGGEFKATAKRVNK
jgi:hypothetical protein